jgi:hypothetical protein
MSVSDEFRRLLLHAADMLAKAEPSARSALTDVIEAQTNGYKRLDATSKLTNFVAASTYAQLVIEMTAKFLTDETSAEEPTDDPA